MSAEPTALRGLRRTGSPPDRDVPLVDLLDRLLETGVALKGDLLLSVAGTDLVWLSLCAVLKGIDEPLPGRTTGETGSDHGPAVIEPTPRATRAGVKHPTAHRSRPPARAVPASGDDAVRQRPRLSIDERDVERGLAQLVLTVVEVLRELMERQALRRIEGARLPDEQVERLGLALMRLNDRMQDLKEQFGLTDDDLQPHLRAVADVG